MIDEEEYYGVFHEDVSSIIVAIDYSDYDYFGDLMWDFASRYSLYPPINTPSLNTIGKYI